MRAIDPFVVPLVERLRSQFDPIEVVLYGSRVCGSPSAHSDADLLVILPIPADQERVEEIEEELGARAPVSVDVVAYTIDELRAELRMGNHFLRFALAHGIAMFPPTGRPSRHASLADAWNQQAAVSRWLDEAQTRLSRAARYLSEDDRWLATRQAAKAARSALWSLLIHLGGDSLMCARVAKPLPAGSQGQRFTRGFDLIAVLTTIGRLDGPIGQGLWQRHGHTLAALRPYALIDAGYGYRRVPSKASVPALVEEANDLVAGVGEAISQNSFRTCDTASIDAFVCREPPQDHRATIPQAPTRRGGAG